MNYYTMPNIFKQLEDVLHQQHIINRAANQLPGVCQTLKLTNIGQLVFGAAGDVI